MLIVANSESHFLWSVRTRCLCVQVCCNGDILLTGATGRYGDAVLVMSPDGNTVKRWIKLKKGGGGAGDTGEGGAVRVRGPGEEEEESAGEEFCIYGERRTTAFAAPAALALARNGVLYVADDESNLIRVYQ